MPHQAMRWSWLELQREAKAFAAGLRCTRTRAGNRIGILAPDRAEWWRCRFATADAGLILVDINPAYRLHELEYALEEGGLRALITETAFQDQRLHRHAAELAPELRASEPGKLASSGFPTCSSSFGSAPNQPGFLNYCDLQERPGRLTRRSSRRSPPASISTTRSISNSPAARPARRRRPP